MKVEQTIGILKRVFACLGGKLRVEPQYACQMIIACVILYNIGRAHNEVGLDLEDIDLEDDGLVDPVDPGTDGLQTRLRIVQQFFT